VKQINRFAAASSRKTMIPGVSNTPISTTGIVMPHAQGADFNVI
jgi:hypothetical protein